MYSSGGRLITLFGNVHAKRAARFHLIFNTAGVVWVLAIFSLFTEMADSLQMWKNGWELSAFAGFDTNATEEAIKSRTIATTQGLAFFHTVFNITNVLLLIFFVPWLEKLVIRLKPSTGDEDEQFRLKYIGTNLMQTPELNITNARKEMYVFARVIEKMALSFMALIHERYKDEEKLAAKMKKREEITDRIELEIVHFLSRISESDLTEESSQKIRSLHRMANDMERIADIYYEMTRNYQRLSEHKIILPATARKDLEDMLELVTTVVKTMRVNIEGSSSDIVMKQIYEIEKEIDAMRDKIKAAHYKRLEKGVYSARAGVIFIDFVNRAEKIGDHIVNVHEALTGIKNP